MFKAESKSTGEVVVVYGVSERDNELMFLIYVCSMWKWVPANRYKPISK